MKLFRLQKPVEVRGRSFWNGRKSLLFTPNADPTDHQWYWRCVPGAPAVPITAELAEYKRGRLRLRTTCRGKRYVLEIWEHIGSLRFLMPGVTITGHGWTPWFGGPVGYVHQLQPNWREVEVQLKCYEVKENVHVEAAKANQCGFVPSLYFSPSSGCDRFRSPDQRRRLNLEACCKYPDMEMGMLSGSFPDLEGLICLLQVGSPRLHWFQEVLAALGSWLARWPYRDAQVSLRKCLPPKREMSAEDWERWRQTKERSQTAARKFIQHRTGDLLGALSLLCQDGMLVGELTSRYAGHKLDLKMVKQAAAQLVEYPPLD